MPPPYVVRAREPFKVVVNGRTIDFPKKGSIVEVQSPCELVALVDAITRQTGRGTGDGTPEGMEKVREECRASQGGADAPLAPPDTPAVDSDPSPPEKDGAPPGGEESSETLNAPDPPLASEVEGEPRLPGEPDDRSAAEQLLDPQLPRSDFEVADNLARRGLTPDQISDELENARRNLPPPAAPHPEFSRNLRRPLDATVDPVLLFSGQFQLTVTDVEIASAGFPLRFTRLYRSGITFFGPLGFNWDHNYNVYIRRLDGGRVAVWTGALAEEVYTPAPGGFEAPFAVFRKLELLLADGVRPDRFVLSEREGRQLVFSTPVGWPDPSRVPLTSVEDRFGNTHLLSYDPQGRLDRVTDHAGRFLRLQYGDCNLLEALHDHTGRTWRYQHDSDIEHLRAVVTPATPDFPQGIRTSYDYGRFHPHPSLRHNMVRVLDHEDRPVVENLYGDDPSTDDFNRVVFQQFGSFRSEFAATRLQFVPPGPDSLNIPALRVEVIDPGYFYVYTFNNRGDLLDKRFRLTVDRSFRLVASTFRYDEQGNLIERYDADGRGFLYQYDSKHPDPRARGNLLRIEERASPLAPAPSREMFRFTYEPVFFQLKTARDAAGALTEFIYDFERTPPPPRQGALVELRHPVRTMPDGTTRRAIETFAYNERGQLRRHEENGSVHLFDYETAGLRADYLRGRTSSKNGTVVRETMERDTVGNLTVRIDGDGNRQEYDLSALGLLVETRLPDGAVWRFEYDTANHLAVVHEPRGDYDDPVLAGRPIRHELRYNPLGHLESETQGANTEAPRTTIWLHNAEGEVLEVRDPIGRVLRRLVDERGLAVREDLFDSDGSLFVSRTFSYSKVGQLLRAATGEVAVSFGYDGFGRLQTVHSPEGLVVTYARDPRGLITTIEASGPLGPAGSGSGLLARRRHELDEPGNIRRVFEVVFSDPAGPFVDLPSAFFRDDAGDPERMDSATGLVTTRRYGPYGLLLSEGDSLGNLAVISYSPAARPTSLQLTEASSAGGAPVTATHLTRYDPLGRVGGETDPLGNDVTYHYDARGALRRLINPLGSVLELEANAFGELVLQRLGGAAMRWTRDLAGRVTRLLDPAGRETGFEYDPTDRLTAVIRSDGARQELRYEATGALREFQDFDGTLLTYTSTPSGLPGRVVATPGPGVEATPDIVLEYDGLRRPVLASHGGVSHRFRYDSLGRLLAEEGPDVVRMSYDPAGNLRRLSYPDLRRDRREHDARGRLVQVVLEATAPAPLGSLPAGAVLGRFDWRGVDRPARMRVGSGVDTGLVYDTAQRLIQHATTGAGANVQRQDWFLDRLGLRRGEVRSRAAASSQREHRYDQLTRLTRARDGLGASPFPASAVGLTQPQLDAAITAAAAAPAAHETEWTYHPADTPERRVERDGAGTVIATRTFSTNALEQIDAVDGLPLTYDGAGDLVGRGARTYRYDAHRRLVEVQEGGSPVVRLQYDGLGRVHRLETGTGGQRFAYWQDELIQVSGPAPRQLTPSSMLDRPFTVDLGGRTFALVSDSMGSLVAACDPAGAVLERYAYDFFGAPTIFAPDGTTVRSSSAIGLEPRFHGRPWLDAARLYDFRNRFYDPELQIFVQPDPLLLSGSWSHYGFVRYNPINYIDPYGAFWFATILVGAVAGAVIGGVGAALHGGDWKDVLAGIGAGAVGGALFGAGMPVLGAAVSGGMMGAWSGGRIGNQLGGTGGMVAGALAGGLLGAGLGAASGAIASRAGAWVSGKVFLTLTTRAQQSGWTALATSRLARYGSMAVGGYAGGAAAGIFGNTGSTIAVDLATDRPVTLDQLGTAWLHGVAIDGPLNAVGAAGERFLLLRTFRGNLSNRLGAEGEALTAREIGFAPANGRERYIINGRERRTDFLSWETLRTRNVVVESKYKQALSPRDVAQLRDAAQFAQQNGGDLLLTHRPGLDLTPVAGIGNLRAMPTPQRPLVVAPLQAAADLGRKDEGPK